MDPALLRQLLSDLLFTAADRNVPTGTLFHQSFRDVKLVHSGPTSFRNVILMFRTKLNNESGPESLMDDPERHICIHLDGRSIRIPMAPRRVITTGFDRNEHGLHVPSDGLHLHFPNFQTQTRFQGNFSKPKPHRWNLLTSALESERRRAGIAPLRYSCQDTRDPRSTSRPSLPSPAATFPGIRFSFVRTQELPAAAHQPVWKVTAQQNSGEQTSVDKIIDRPAEAVDGSAAESGDNGDGERRIVFGLCH